MTLTELAEASGLTKSFLSKIERDHAQASVASLIRICGVLGVDVGALFEAPTGDCVRAGEYPPINFGGEGLAEYLLTPRSEQRIQAILSVIEPDGGSGAELYSLPSEVEFAMVMEGRLSIRFEDHELALGAGDTLTFSADVRHTFHNASDTEPARVLWVCSPALPAERPYRLTGDD